MDKNMGIGKIKHISMIVLSFILALSMMPVFAFADGVVDAVDEPAAAEIQTDGEEVSVGSIISNNSEVSATENEEPENSEEPGPVVFEQEAEEALAVSEEEEPELDAETIDAELSDADELLQEYFDTKIDVGTGTVLKGNSSSETDSVPAPKQRSLNLSSRISHLSSEEQEVYYQIKPYIVKIASGELNEAKFYVDHYANVNYPSVINALVNDMPYEFYWYDKVVGYLHGTDPANPSNGRHLFIMAVSKDYWNNSISYNYHGEPFVYGLNTTKTKGTKDAIDNVTYILGQAASYSDIDKLYGYMNLICNLVSYDNSAAYAVTLNSSGLNREPFYGDPWQLISVFDGNDETKVVCEGYSKAFQYLCDRTEFKNSSIECYTVQGDFFSGSSSKGAGHMWNIIHMDDGLNYMADITNCDGRYGPEWFFLAGWMGNESNVETGYRYKVDSIQIKYVYDDLTRGLFSESELTLSDTRYSENLTVKHFDAKEPTCTEAGAIERWLKGGYYYDSADCSHRVSYNDVQIKPLGHDWKGTVVIAATEETTGLTHYVCERCGDTKDEVTPMLPHSHRYTAAETLDNTIYTCKVCGYSYTSSKVIIDRSRVSIKKPAVAKKGFTVKWKKVSKKNRKKISGIEIQYSTRRDFADAYSILKTASRSKTSKKIGNLEKKKTYYVRVRSYKWINGVKHVSKWSSVKKVRTR